MTRRNDPVRWPTDDGSMPDELRAMLEAAQQEHGRPAHVASLAAKLGPLLAPSSSAASAGPTARPPTATGTLTLWKGAVIGVGLLAGGALTWMLPESKSEQVSTQPRAPRVELQIAPRTEALPSLEPVPAHAEMVVKAPKQRAVARLPARRVHEPIAPQDAIKAEAALLNRARAALAHDTAQTWRAIHAHESRFPAGLLVEERENLAIQCLIAMRMPGDARRRLRAFEADFPASAHTSGLRALVEREAQPSSVP